jgi:hypothetical protein
LLLSLAAVQEPGQPAASAAPAYEEDDVISAAGPPSRPPAGGTPSDPEALHVYVASMGPLCKRGKYRVRLILYDGFQPVEAAPGVLVGASSHHVELTRKLMRSQKRSSMLRRCCVRACCVWECHMRFGA